MVMTDNAVIELLTHALDLGLRVAVQRLAGQLGVDPLTVAEALDAALPAGAGRSAEARALVLDLRPVHWCTAADPWRPSETSRAVHPDAVPEVAVELGGAWSCHARKVLTCPHCRHQEPA